MPRFLVSVAANLVVTARNETEARVEAVVALEDIDGEYIEVTSVERLGGA